MNLLVDGPAYWPTEEIARNKVWLYLKSCDKFGIQPLLYGIGCTQFQGETPMRISGQIETLQIAKRNYEYTHVLFTDLWDVMFVAPLDEIIEKYKNMGAPHCLIGGASRNMNVHPDNLYDDRFDQSKRYRYMTPSFYIAEIPYILEAFSRMECKTTHDQSPDFMKGWIEGWFRPMIDSNCEIFGIDDDNYCMRDGRVFNMHTGTYPSVFHARGGDYVDPETGRDHLLLPWAKRLGIV